MPIQDLENLLSEISKDQGPKRVPRDSIMEHTQSLLKAGEQEQEASLVDRGVSAIKAVPSIAKAGVEKVASGIGDIKGGFQPETFVARQGEDQAVPQEIAGDRDFSNRLEQIGQGLQRIGAGSLTAAFGATPLGAGAGAAIGALEPEVKKVIESGAVQNIIDKFHTLEPDIQESFLNLAESLPFAPKGSQKVLTEGLKQTGQAAKASVVVPTQAVGSGVAQILGKTTGAGANAIKEAFKQSTKPTFQKALSGEVSNVEILDAAKKGFETIKEQRSVVYGKDYKILETNKNKLDINDVQDNFVESLGKDRVKVDAEGKLDFSESTISQSKSQTQIQSMFDDIMTWNDTTPVGLDILKQRVQDRFTGSAETAKADRISTIMGNKVKDKIVSEVPEYADMTRKYAAVTEEIRDIQKTLALGNNAQKMTAITRLNQALKDNIAFRKEAVELLEKASGIDLKPALAGAALSEVAPKGLVGAISGGLVGYGMITSLITPGFIVGLLAASPRVIGEVARAFGMTKNAFEAALRSIQKGLSKTKQFGEDIADVVTGTTKEVR